MQVEGKVFMVGNSNALRIPKVFMDAMGMRKGDKVDMLIENNRLIISKKEDDRYPSIDELFKDYDGDYSPCEMPSGSIGKEIL